MHFGIVSRIFYTPSGKAILKLFRWGKVYAIVALSRKYAFFMEMSKNNIGLLVWAQRLILNQTRLGEIYHIHPLFGLNDIL